jgi:hypothetical protein
MVKSRNKIIANVSADRQRPIQIGKAIKTEYENKIRASH